MSPQAVSRWEKDSAMPDISLIPPICNFFGVTSDYLLGIDAEHRKEQIEKIIAEADKLSFRGCLKEAREIIEDALKTYPDNYRLLKSLIHISFNRSCIEHKEVKKKEYAEETIKTGERILEGCTDDVIRHTAIQLLCYTYPKYGMSDKARTLAEKMPPMLLSEECLLSIIETGAEKCDILKRKLYSMLEMIIRDVVSLITEENKAYTYSDCERAAILKKPIHLVKALFENGDYGGLNDPLMTVNAMVASEYAAQKDKPWTFYHLSAAANCAIGFIEYYNNPDYRHTSCLFTGYGRRSVGTNTTDNSAQLLLNEMNNNNFDFIRNTKEYIEIEERLKKCAGKW